MKKDIGIAVLVVSLIALFGSYNIDTTVEYTYKNYETGRDEVGRTSNDHLTEDKRNYLMLSSLGCVVGVILIATYKKDPNNENDKDESNLI